MSTPRTRYDISGCSGAFGIITLAVSVVTELRARLVVSLITKYAYQACARLPFAEQSRDTVSIPRTRYSGGCSGAFGIITLAVSVVGGITNNEVRLSGMRPSPFCRTVPVT